MPKSIQNKHLRAIIRSRYRTIGGAASVWGVTKASVHKWLRRGVITYRGGQILKSNGISLAGLPVEAEPNKGGYPKHSRRSGK